MARIIVSENVTLDGVMQDPTGDEGFVHGGWFTQIDKNSREAWAKLKFEESLTTDALLLGRCSDSWFGSRWNGRTGEWADRLNSLPKYVVSSSPDAPQWRNSTVIAGDVATTVSTLKRDLDGEIVVFASGQLVQTLFEHDLVDEVRLTVYPVVLGAGDRLFREASDKRAMRLVSSQTIGHGLTQLAYAVVRNA